MELEFWGVRGTFPLTGKPASAFGGNTPCAAVTSRQGDILIVDAGTGIHALGNKLAAEHEAAPLRLSLLLTHFHLDHVQGLPFFGPLFLPNTEISFYSAADPEETRAHLERLMGHPFFPMPFEQTPAKKTFKKAGAESIMIGAIRVSACPLNHPQGSVAYRLEEENTAVVFATDTEPATGSLDERLAGFAEEASCLVYDAMFTPEEYVAGKQGWGHSTWLDGTKLAKASGSSRLLLSHFNYEHSDRVIRGFERLSQRVFPDSECAREGLRLRLAQTHLRT